jgi:hypothetical protein
LEKKLPTLGQPSQVAAIYQIQLKVEELAFAQ